MSGAGLSLRSGVNPQNNTETFGCARTESANWRWAGVPFYIRTGKRHLAGRIALPASGQLQTRRACRYPSPLSNASTITGWSSICNGTDWSCICWPRGADQRYNNETRHVGASAARSDFDKPLAPSAWVRTSGTGVVQP
jgi:hypothetical protein